MSEVNIDSLLDSTLDDLADLPEFKAFPAGAHTATIKFSQKEVNKHPCIEMGIKGIETKELTNATDSPIEAGAETSILFMLDNDIGQGKFKEVMKSLQAHFNTGTNRETIEAANGAEVLLVTKVRTDSKDTDRKYTDIVSLQVV